MKKIQVSQNNMLDTANKIETAANDYRELYKTRLLDNAVNQVTESYQGKDSDAFAAKIREFEPGFAKMYDLMIQYAQYLRKSAASYTEVQESTISAINTIDNTY